MILISSLRLKNDNTKDNDIYWHIHFGINCLHFKNELLQKIVYPLNYLHIIFCFDNYPKQIPTTLFTHNQTPKDENNKTKFNNNKSYQGNIFIINIS